MADEPAVDIGPVPLAHARSVQAALGHALDAGLVWDAKNWANIVEVRAVLALRIAQAVHAVKTDA